MRLSIVTLLCFFCANAFAAEQLRIVSAGGSVTEIIATLGAGKQLVAVDTSSTYPAAVNALPKVGYFRQLAPEGVISTGATHLLTVQGAGPESGIAQIRSTGMHVSVFAQPHSIEGLKSLITQIGDTINKKQEAAQLNREVSKQLAVALATTKTLPSKNIAFLMAITDHGIMAAGKETVPDLIISLLGMANVYKKVQGFKSVSPESLLVNPPDLILMPSHRTGGLTATALCEKSVLKLWSTKYGCNLIVVDPLQFLGLTPRLPNAMLQVANWFQESSK